MLLDRKRCLKPQIPCSTRNWSFIYPRLSAWIPPLLGWVLPQKFSVDTRTLLLCIQTSPVCGVSLRYAGFPYMIIQFSCFLLLICRMSVWLLEQPKRTLRVEKNISSLTLLHYTYLASPKQVAWMCSFGGLYFYNSLPVFLLWIYRWKFICTLGKCILLYGFLKTKIMLDIFSWNLIFFLFLKMSCESIHVNSSQLFSLEGSSNVYPGFLEHSWLCGVNSIALYRLLAFLCPSQDISSCLCTSIPSLSPPSSGHKNSLQVWTLFYIDATFLHGC